MRVRLLGVGKIKEPYLQAGIQEYLKRLVPYAKVEMLSLGDEPIPDGAVPAQEEQVRWREGERILRALDTHTYVVALDSHGQLLTSEEFARFLAERGIRSESHLTFVIGGSLGLSSEVLRRADYRLALGRMTFLHQMVPLLLLEQIYRGFRINRGEPYHK